MYYGWPEEPESYDSGGQYMLGGDILVAPVVGPADGATGLAPQRTWLPPGTNWVDTSTGRALFGGQVYAG